MELHQIKYFLAVARERNFTKAARACHVSQPSLTRAIGRLENELGGMVFERKLRGSELTALGRVVLPRLKMARRAVTMAVDQARKLEAKGTVSPNAERKIANTRTLDLPNARTACDPQNGSGVNLDHAVFDSL